MAIVHQNSEIPYILELFQEKLRKKTSMVYLMKVDLMDIIQEIIEEINPQKTDQWIDNSLYDLLNKQVLAKSDVNKIIDVYAENYLIKHSVILPIAQEIVIYQIRATIPLIESDKRKYLDEWFPKTFEEWVESINIDEAKEQSIKSAKQKALKVMDHLKPYLDICEVTNIDKANYMKCKIDELLNTSNMTYDEAKEVFKNNVRNIIPSFDHKTQERIHNIYLANEDLYNEVYEGD